LRFILITLGILLLLSCKDFEVIQATKQHWSGGIPSSGGGINYDIVILARANSDKLQIDQLWVRDKYYKVMARRGLPATAQEGFAKNDTIYIKAKHVFPERLNPRNRQKPAEPPRSDSLKLPIEYVGDALLGFTINNKRKYKTIEKMERLNPFPMP